MADNVQVSMALDFKSQMITLTPKTVNGIAVLNPVAIPIPMDKWLEVSCQLIMRQIAQREAGLTTATALVGLDGA